MRVAFFGTPQFAVPSIEALLASRHVVCGVVTQPDRPRGRGHTVTDGPVKDVARRHQVPIEQPATLADPAIESALRAWAPDLGVVVAYGQLIPRPILALPPHGLINVHASLLPRYRGAAPIHRAVINGDTTTGVSIMRVAPKLDAGPVFASAARPIALSDTSEDVEHDLAHLGAQLLLEVMAAIDAGAAVETPQDDSTCPALDLHNRVRGLQPWPLAATEIRNARVIVLESAPLSYDGAEPPGTVVRVDHDHLHVAAGAGTCLALVRVQPEGRRPMAVRDFLAGNPVRLGQPLSAA
jgi:methionyl-tRNA formyltransferase